ncbi:hypothetical protein L6164_008508 [Bauhinia variegata]|uniref:Uncharacterized protein n=1 Tax=Bauhinia variegata TaxID=167791 RepID=A0ACB9PIE5_BAUVA|nr:hypothetical protein L6164_008508 [Bauhinia variegata]
MNKEATEETFSATIARRPKSNNTHDDKEPDNLTDLEVVQHPYGLFDKFKGLIVGKIFSVRERNESWEFFYGLSYTDALRVIEVELNFKYEVFYTKVSVLLNKSGYFLRFVSFSSLVAATTLFILDDKRSFKKFDIRVTYTLLYGALGLDFIAFVMLVFSDRTLVPTKRSEKKSFIGAIFKFFGFFKQYFIEIVMVPYLKIKCPEWSPCKKQPYTKYHRLSTRFAIRRWSGSISGYNFIIYCIGQCPKDTPRINFQSGFIRAISEVIKLVCFKIKQFQKNTFDKVAGYFGANDLIVTWKYKENNPFLQELWKFILDELKRKSEEVVNVDSAKKICSYRGENIIRESKDLDTELKGKLMPFVDSKEVTFDESLMLWYIATHLCYEEDDDEISKEKKYDDEVCGKLHFSKLLSDYMLYLLIMQPTMMSPIAGIGQRRFKDVYATYAETNAEAIRFFRRRDLEPGKKEDANKGSQIVKAACKNLLAVCTVIKPVHVKGDRSKSVLFHACRLAKQLNDLQDRNLKWRTIAKIWVEILSYAAANCRPTAHVQQIISAFPLPRFLFSIATSFETDGVIIKWCPTKAASQLLHDQLYKRVIHGLVFSASADCFVCCVFRDSGNVKPEWKSKFPMPTVKDDCVVLDGDPEVYLGRRIRCLEVNFDVAYENFIFDCYQIFFQENI